MIPDKLYLSPVIYGAVTNLSPNPDCEDVVEYIRKDALIEWLKKDLAGYAEEIYSYERYDEGAKNALKEVITKINSM